MFEVCIARSKNQLIAHKRLRLKIWMVKTTRKGLSSGMADILDIERSGGTTGIDVMTNAAKFVVDPFGRSVRLRPKVLLSMSSDQLNRKDAKS